MCETTTTVDLAAIVRVIRPGEVECELLKKCRWEDILKKGGVNLKVITVYGNSFIFLAKGFYSVSPGSLQQNPDPMETALQSALGFYKQQADVTKKLMFDWMTKSVPDGYILKEDGTMEVIDNETTKGYRAVLSAIKATTDRLELLLAQGIRSVYQ